MEIKHPNYYKNLRKLARLRNRDQAISLQSATAASERAPGTGLRGQAEVLKQRDSTGGVPGEADISVTSLKQQATSNKRQAPSSEKNKPQAPSPKRQASS